MKNKLTLRLQGGANKKKAADGLRRNLLISGLAEAVEVVKRGRFTTDTMPFKSRANMMDTCSQLAFAGWSGELVMEGLCLRFSEDVFLPTFNNGAKPLTAEEGAIIERHHGIMRYRKNKK